MTPRAQSANRDISGAEIRAVRSYWGMPRAEFADHFGVASSTVYLWESLGVTSRNQKFDSATFRILKLYPDVLGP